MKIHFIYRKTNPGNYSIESIYDQLLSYWKKHPEHEIDPIKVQLNYNYDLGAFLRCWFGSLLGNYKCIHVTGGCHYMMLAFPRARRILTIHDLVRFQEPNMRFWGLYRLLFYTLPIRFSHKIIVVSEATKAVLVNQYPKAKDKIEVIDNPLHPSFIEAGKKLNSAARPNKPLHILQIGDKALKNYERLLEATHRLHVEYTFIHANTERIKTLLKQYKLNDKARILSALSQEKLLQAYCEADVLFFASQAEGFGLPLIEAQAIGLPIITSDRLPMKTLAPYALLVDPNSADQIRSAVQSIIEKGINNNQLQQAKNEVSRYEVKHIAEAYRSVYLRFA